ncbi:ultraviolet-B receptor UVR8-like [Bidens hawaiensis]|uniref:ultraviolet-B receptor UVR8-like n=1 Tax=Bidens hawaiensis TaxID=980011 RepID=UPI00404B225B
MDTEDNNLSRKGIAIATGEAHTLALTADGMVYSWGRGTFGRLGNASEIDQHFPIKIHFNNNNIKIIGISAGAYHSLALADDGSVWSWGYNTYGQLGVEGDNSFVPCLVKMPLIMDASATNNEKPLKISSVKAGGMVSLAIDDLGHLWMWGTLQGTSIEMESTPTIPISINFNNYTVVKAACGGGHIVTIVNNGSNLTCYSWGNNDHGQLGLGDTEMRANPQIIETFNTLEPYEVSCGASHTCVLAYSTKTESQSVCYSFGHGSNGQLGLGTTKDSPSPEKVTGLPGNLVLVSIDRGLFHTSVVSSSGHVWSWGMENGLGLCPEASFVETDGGDALSPRLINGPDFKQPVQVACGAAHTVVLADSGYKLWSWGRGRSGVLGNGQDVDFFKPKAVLWPPPNEAVSETAGKIIEKDAENVTDMEKKLSGVMEELTFVRSKLSLMESYVSILHGSIFGRPFEGDRDMPVSLRDPHGTFDITKEWENMLELCDRRKLVRLQMFYRNMLAGVEDKMLKLRVKEMLKEYLESSAGSSTKT